MSVDIYGSSHELHAEQERRLGCSKRHRGPVPKPAAPSSEANIISLTAVRRLPLLESRREAPPATGWHLHGSHKETCTYRGPRQPQGLQLAAGTAGGRPKIRLHRRVLAPLGLWRRVCDARGGRCGWLATRVALLLTWAVAITLSLGKAGADETDTGCCWLSAPLPVNIFQPRVASSATARAKARQPVLSTLQTHMLMPDNAAIPRLSRLHAAQSAHGQQAAGEENIIHGVSHFRAGGTGWCCDVEGEQEHADVAKCVGCLLKPTCHLPDAHAHKFLNLNLCSTKTITTHSFGQ